ncbi:MAG: hypothetical protein ACREIV_01815 [Planctomycetaceae bacterium]
MPKQNRFRHQDYTADEPATPFHLLTAARGPDCGGDEFRRRTQAVGDALRDAGIEAISLAHGTFVGGDAVGLWTELSRLFPSWADTFHRVSKLLLDTAMGERSSSTCTACRFATSAKPQARIRLRSIPELCKETAGGGKPSPSPAGVSSAVQPHAASRDGTAC